MTLARAIREEANEMSSETNKRLARLVTEEVWNKGNIEVAEEIFAADVVRNDANWPQVRGIEMYKQTLMTARTAFPNWSESIHDMVSEGDKVACRVTISGTHTGDLLGNPPTGKHFELPCLVIYRVAGNQIAELWSIWDALNFFRILGISPIQLEKT
jgi:steroid delta-isomerase-like uncharacterized protein